MNIVRSDIVKNITELYAVRKVSISCNELCKIQIVIKYYKFKGNKGDLDFRFAENNGGKIFVPNG